MRGREPARTRLQSGFAGGSARTFQAFDLFEGVRQGIAGDRVHKSKAQSVRSMNFLGRDEHRKSTRLSNQARQALRATPAGDQAQGGAAMSKHRGRGRDATMTSEREIEAPTHAVAGNGSEDWRWELRDRVHQVLAHAGERIRLRARECGDLAQVRACRKEFRIAGDDERARSGRQFEDGPGQRENARPSQTISPVLGGQA